MKKELSKKEPQIFDLDDLDNMDLTTLDTVMRRVVCFNRPERPAESVTVEKFNLVSYVSKMGIKKKAKTREYIEFRRKAGENTGEGYFYKNGKNLSSFEIDCAKVEKYAARRGTIVQSGHSVAFNGAIALKDDKKRLHISKSTVVWTPITKDGKIAGFMMTYPGKYKRYKAYFGVEVKDERKRLDKRFETFERAKSLATHVWSAPAKQKLHPTLLKTIEKVEALQEELEDHESAVRETRCTQELIPLYNDIVRETVATLSENRETVPTLESENDDPKISTIEFHLDAVLASMERKTRCTESLLAELERQLSSVCRKLERSSSMSLIREEAVAAVRETGTPLRLSEMSDRSSDLRRYSWYLDMVTGAAAAKKIRFVKAMPSHTASICGTTGATKVVERDTISIGSADDVMPCVRRSMSMPDINVSDLRKASFLSDDPALTEGGYIEI